MKATTYNIQDLSDIEKNVITEALASGVLFRGSLSPLIQVAQENVKENKLTDADIIVICACIEAILKLLFGEEDAELRAGILASKGKTQDDLAMMNLAFTLTLLKLKKLAGIS